MSENTELLRFLTTGEIGRIKLGISIKETVDFLGNPDEALNIDEFLKRGRDRPHTSGDGRRIIPVLYGCLELILDIELLDIISIKVNLDDYPYSRLPHPLSNFSLENLKGVTSTRFLKYLAENEIESHVESYSTSEALYFRIVKSGVTIAFDIEGNNDEMLSLITSIWARKSSE